MTQDELTLLHARIRSLMDQTMAIHEKAISSGGARSRCEGLWQPVAWAMSIMTIGAVWGICCVLLVRAL
ncbi:hypothetical protein [Pandoraea apista]|uniref:hypothetical protein n=1 Tax=Pandoraea apista TaxID=93218 RepID=UPI000659367C|nr:hypothetical protein [Pandoraea apista]ALS64575.1 hypothetical protein AT395_05880 [Pandoraea apista]RRW88471.1 hypothetical protein EGJ54_24735 [Pandoraea apista]RRW96836.1 hypothetical protein EGJ56_24715 [Pandoraea apista]CFB64516.1 hypothetical protein LMG16407_04374 [Pandoraea apista]